VNEFDDLEPPTFEVTLLMADAAQIADRKLYILGGGISIIGPRPTPIAVAMLLKVPWALAGKRHEWALELLDEDYSPVMTGERPLLVSGAFEATRPEGLPHGIPLDVPLAINFTALPVKPATRYTWRLSIDGTSEQGWQTSFTVRAEQQA
jgi:hypothetical protein